ncbi:MAG: hypothetical protein DMG77_06655 [Acidobacteria bacterium]|nr:MAG: hypothetical protein DMG77_06655 [Acidobacteriota bacterium]
MQNREVYDRIAVSTVSVAERSGLRPRILLVEDEQIIRDALVPILFSAGYDCREAADGRAAIDLLNSGVKINLILSNVFLPEVNGWELFLHCRQHYPHIPFVFVTALKDASLSRAAIREGAAGYLRKPFERDELIAIVRNVFGD